MLCVHVYLRFRTCKEVEVRMLIHLTNINTVFIIACLSEFRKCDLEN